MSERSRDHVVSVTVGGTDEPLIFGPYTRRRAEELAAKFNERVDHSAFGYVNAVASRINNPGIEGMLAQFS